MTMSLSKNKGVTLIEVLLVLVIASSILLMIIGYSNQRMNQLRMDRTVMQMQQLLNAGLAYYVNTGTWPTAVSDLQPAYLPNNFKNTWGGTYQIISDQGTQQSGVLKVKLDLASKLSAGPTANALLATLAGQLPTGEADIDNRAVTAQVNIPGQNLNNARAVNFASIYSSGACVPAPKCPGTMKPQIMVVPVAVRGIYDTATGTTAIPKVYPLTSFTAFARGANTAGDPIEISPYDCAVESAKSPKACLNVDTDVPNTKYWRVCLSVITDKGLAYPNAGTNPEKDKHGEQLGSILAITRCAPATENPTGTPFGVFTPNVNYKP